MLYVKTAAGRAEVPGRTHALSPSQRQVLILCDGVRYVETLGETVKAEALGPALSHRHEHGLVVLQDAAPDDPRREDFEEIHKAAAAAVEVVSAIGAGEE